MTTVVRNETTMGYPFHITVNAELKPHNINPVIRLACHTIDYLEALFDFGNSKSIINLYNKGEVKLSDTPQQFQEVMLECLMWQKTTDSIFTPFNRNLINEQHSGNIFDPRGILKSYSMKLLSETLTAFNMADHRIQVWDDIYISDKHENVKDWTVDFKQPLTLQDSKQTVIELNFQNTHMRAISKSNLQDNRGDVWVKTLHTPIVSDFTETTIIANTPTASDVWSIVCLTEGYPALERINKHNENMLRLGTPENMVEGIMVTGDYQYVQTDGFKKYIN